MDFANTVLICILFILWILQTHETKRISERVDALVEVADSLHKIVQAHEDTMERCRKPLEDIAKILKA